jgi:DNA-binding transcriptional MerR regulator
MPMEQALSTRSDPIASAVRTLREQGMPSSEITTVLEVEEPSDLRRYMELHAERLAERLAAERRALAEIERFLAMSIMERTDHPARRETIASVPTKRGRHDRA